jgi:sterol desaturase/sphingolipid hydroxylase (fatty acid hydroxylase superfamily)
MGPNYIALAVPFFFLLIGIELAIAHHQKKSSYRFTDAIADLGCGITQRIVLLFCEALLLLAYVQLYQHARIVDLGRWPVVAGLVAFVAMDFIYYWWHRASHRLNFLWAAHVVHHQSEDFNLAVALRQGVLTPLTMAPFAFPLALLGIPPLIYVAAISLNTLYQFWIHTELVGNLGRLRGCSTPPPTTGFTTPGIRAISIATTPPCSSSGTVCSARSCPSGSGPNTASRDLCAASIPCGRRFSRLPS